MTSTDASQSPHSPNEHAAGPSGSDDAIASKKSVYEILMDQQAEGRSSSGMYTPEAALHRPVPVYQPKNSASSNPEFTLGTLTRRSIPVLTPWYPVPGPNSSMEGPPPDFSWLSESCGGKAAMGVFGGAVCGLLMGVFLGAMSDMTPPVTVIDGKEVPQAPLKEQVRTTLRATGEKCLYWSRNFAFITGVFGGTECLVEKYRGKHDVWNAAIGGCVTGAALQAKQGPQAAAIGCGGFAVFSLV
eukprot:CAMPEP_0197463812 /NCGR_PEP_ID=MMETSP1175-20131217/62796_1 /TAXON_ID=1003142 /ORGANISM="Triceratium dubium, Strain CCMP147" /LENGTH=242 /DNA_ID=CAMNT_0042999657 /DNA_START=209 /DNA_END=933 /DNA_ORIENTATION=-